MSRISVIQLNVSEYGTNCYICGSPDTNECVIIDPGAEAEKIRAEIEKAAFTPAAILLTHGHFDHIGAAKEIKEFYGIPIAALSAEDKVLRDPDVNLTGYFSTPVAIVADRFVMDGEILDYAGLDIRVIATPGHTCGSCCYYLKEDSVLFSGDTLFCASRGRTDFPTGSETAILNSIREKLLCLPGDTAVYPGHMERTTISREMKYY